MAITASPSFLTVFLLKANVPIPKDKGRAPFQWLKLSLSCCEHTAFTSINRIRGSPGGVSRSFGQYRRISLGCGFAKRLGNLVVFSPNSAIRSYRGPGMPSNRVLYPRFSWPHIVHSVLVCLPAYEVSLKKYPNRSVLYISLILSFFFLLLRPMHLFIYIHHSEFDATVGQLNSLLHFHLS